MIIKIEGILEKAVGGVRFCLKSYRGKKIETEILIEIIDGLLEFDVAFFEEFVQAVIHFF